MTDERTCPGDEILIAYLEAELGESEAAQVERHLADCDSCVETLRCIHARLQATAADLVPPPEAVVLRVRRALAPAAAPPQRAVPILLRLPILIPASLAAGMLLTIATHTWLASPPPAVLKRSAQMQRTTHAAPVRAQPSVDAEVLARTNAGEIVEVRDEQAGWCRIGLPERGEGWVECQALE